MVNVKSINSMYWNKNHVFHIADIRDKHTIDIIFQFEKPDIVIHGAGESNGDSLAMVSTNVLGTQNIIDACIKHKVEKFLYISTNEISAKHETIIPNLYLTTKISGGLLALTATDMAPLCGVNPQACIRKYFSKPIRTEYCHELAIRIVTSFLALSAAKYELGISIIFSHSTYHYIRVYAQVNHSLGAANASIKKIGYIFHCPHCLNRKWSYNFVNIEDSNCNLCGKGMSIAGPLWLGELFSLDFCKNMLIEGSKRRGFEKASKLVETILKENSNPTYYVLDKVSENIKMSSLSKFKVIKKLVEEGYQTVPTHFNPKGIKSNASIDVIKRVIKEISQHK